MSIDINKFTEDFWIFNFRSEILEKDLQWTWDPKVRHQALNYETWIPSRGSVIFLKDYDMDIREEFFKYLDLEIQATRDLINKRARLSRALANEKRFNNLQNRRSK